MGPYPSLSGLVLPCVTWDNARSCSVFYMQKCPCGLKCLIPPAPIIWGNLYCFSIPTWSCPLTPACYSPQSCLVTQLSPLSPYHTWGRVTLWPHRVLFPPLNSTLSWFSLRIKKQNWFVSMLNFQKILITVLCLSLFSGNIPWSIFRAPYLLIIAIWFRKIHVHVSVYRQREKEKERQEISTYKWGKM